VRRVIEGYGGAPGLPGDFAYLRCRRIVPEALLEIDHVQIWTALQLLHMGALCPFENRDGFLWANKSGKAALCYVPDFSEQLAPALRQAIATVNSLTLYSWQPGIISQSMNAPNVQYEAIPEALARKFGLRG
jgi:hypothetical protein